MLQMSPNGVNSLGTVTSVGYVGGNGATKYPQSFAGTYGSSSGAMVLTFPNSTVEFSFGAVLSLHFAGWQFRLRGIAGGSTCSSGSGQAPATPSLGGLYYQAGIDQDESQLLASGYAILDTYYGAISANSGSIVGHQRVLELLATGGSYDYTYADKYTLTSTGTYSSPVMNYVVGGDGIRIGSGIGPIWRLMWRCQPPRSRPTACISTPRESSTQPVRRPLPRESRPANC